MTMTAQEALVAYERARHRLPSPGLTKTSRMARDISELADLFDVFLLDAFGVLNIGETAIEGTPERVATLQAAGKRVMVVSNAAGFPHDTLMQKYTRLGYSFAPEDVVTSRAALVSALRTAPPRAWGLMASRAAGIGELDAFDVTWLAEDRAAYDAVEGFLLIGAAEWTEERHALLEASLRDNPRPVWVGNPDIVAPREIGFTQEPGHFAHRLADATGIAPEFFGKPFTNIYDLAFARLGPVDPARVLMVGDSLHTDILGAQAAGIRSALIAGYGFFGGEDAQAAIAICGICPDFVLQRP
ncbi:HAD-IIA family hydrolase [Thioclava sp. F42-5]|uniref:HAD-IIA family hydrolase n=1 Tax=Thioclava sp. F42-5 TaxID=1973005 RepID=UPI00320466E4